MHNEKGKAFNCDGARGYWFCLAPSVITKTLEGWHKWTIEVAGKVADNEIKKHAHRHSPMANVQPMVVIVQNKDFFFRIVIFWKLFSVPLSLSSRF